MRAPRGIWNQKNKQGWTPLRIAVGVHRGMNFRFSKPTAEALARIMTAAGVSSSNLKPSSAAPRSRYVPAFGSGLSAFALSLRLPGGRN